MAAARGQWEPEPPFGVRQLTIEDGLELAMAPQPAAWQVYDALQPFPPDEGYRAIADARGRLVGYCCLGEAARVAGAQASPAILDVAIGIRPDLAGRGWAGQLGRAAVGYATSVAGGRRLRTMVADWNAGGLRAAGQSGFTPAGEASFDRQRYLVLEQPPPG